MLLWALACWSDRGMRNTEWPLLKREKNRNSRPDFFPISSGIPRKLVHSNLKPIPPMGFLFKEISPNSDPPCLGCPSGFLLTSRKKPPAHPSSNFPTTRAHPLLPKRQRIFGLSLLVEIKVWVPTEATKSEANFLQRGPCSNKGPDTTKKYQPLIVTFGFSFSGDIKNTTLAMVANESWLSLGNNLHSWLLWFSG